MSFKLTYTLVANWTAADKTCTHNRIDRYLRTYAADDVMLMDRLASLDMGFRWHASIHCTTS